VGRMIQFFVARSLPQNEGFDIPVRLGVLKFSFIKLIFKTFLMLLWM
jgi:hypothetical protein